MEKFVYQGGELEVFREAINWKRYCSEKLASAVNGHVLEVGAGIGGTTRFHCRPGLRSWTCLEPDQRLAAELNRLLAVEPLSVPTRVACGTLQELSPGPQFDTILYLDVLEHIDDDRAELRRAAEFLHPGGRVVVLAPAHQWLFSPFDAAIGHYRRYSVESLSRIGPKCLALERAFYLDTVGVIASLLNRALLRAAYPTARQIWFWDTVLVKASRLFDWSVGYRIGKSVVVVWRKD